MSSYLWQVTAIRNNGKVTKGMSVEIIKKGTTAKPNQKEISDALNQKYSANVHSSHCGSQEFNFTQLK